MKTPAVRSIYRYPVKGFGGERLGRADLRAGRGLFLDRHFAIANGVQPAEPDGRWTRSHAFVRLRTHSDLTTFAIETDENARTVSLMGRDDRRGVMRWDGRASDDASEHALRDWFGTRNVALRHRFGLERSAADDAGYWDHPDATLSLINLETIAALERALGQTLDSLRFRANLYIAGLSATEELSWPGRRLRIGSAVLEIMRPTDRCRATSVDPGTGDTSINVPAAIARTFGHVYCGVYARVVESGTVAWGDPVVDVGTAWRVPTKAALPITAPPVSDWPRPASVVERVVESGQVVSFWLDDPLAKARPAVLAGQHVRLHRMDRDGRPTWRAYTVSGVEGSRVRISVKREGSFSTQLHDAMRVGDEVLITGPFGDVTLAADTGTGRPLVLLSAGIGITPAIAMLRELAAGNSKRVVVVSFVARRAEELALWAEAKALAKRLPGARLLLNLTRATPEQCKAHGAVSGRPVVPALIEAALLQRADIYLCGPTGYLREMRSSLIAAGANPKRMRFEVFASPQVQQPSPGRMPAPIVRPSTPVSVRFQSSGVEAVWTPVSGTLLELAEAAGLAMPANCRSGACGTCRKALTSGSVMHHPEPALPVSAGSVLLCCAYPLEDVTIA